MTHRADYEGKPFNWGIVRRTVYIVAGMGLLALSKTGLIDEDTANQLAGDIAYLGTTGLFFLAAWNAK